MAHRSKYERTRSGYFHLEHRYMDGLQFDGGWTYLARNRAGAWRWKALPLPEAPSTRAGLGDPQGAWWCARQCAAVMSPSAVPPQSLVNTPIPHPDSVSLAQALQALLPNCSVQMREVGDTANPAMDVTVNIAADMAKVLQAGGSALLRLESVVRASSISALRWAWMVGIETRHPAHADRSAQEQTDSAVTGSTGTDSTIHALLVVGPHWPAPWGSGFGAKVRPQAGGSWRLASADGEAMHCRVTACIAVLPAVPVVSTMPVSPVAGN